ncbi:MAG: cupredoxin domain-containing protein [Longimicrobiales bacterium]
MMQSRTSAAAVLAFVGFLVVGCISESDSKVAEGEAAGEPAAAPAAGTPAATTVNATLNEWTVTLSAETVANGTVSFEVRNSGTEDHAFEVEGNNQEWKTDPIKPGEAVTLSAPLAPGTYTIYCPIASGGESHADRGMKATITVN